RRSRVQEFRLLLRLPTGTCSRHDCAYKWRIHDPASVNRDVFVVVFQRLSILGDLDGIRIENANRDMFPTKFHRPICGRDPAFKGGTSAFVADRHFYIGSFKWPNSDAILLV